MSNSSAATEGLLPAPPHQSLSGVTSMTASYTSMSSVLVSKPPPNSHIPHRKSTELEIHGDEAIRLLQHTSTAYGKCFDISRLIFASFLLMLSVFSIVYAFTKHATLFPTSIPNWTLYLVLFTALFCLGVFEGLQIAVVELAHENPDEYKTFYPRAAKLLQHENTGNNVERFLIGRQVLVVLLVFVCARVTTFSVFIFEVPEWIMNTFMFSGFLGVILVVTVAQLTPQVLAAAYPVEFLNLYGMTFAFNVCLLVETTGIVHVVWLLCYGIKTLVYSCVCKHHISQKKSMMHLQRNGATGTTKHIEMHVGDQTANNKMMMECKEFQKNNSKVIVEIEQMKQQMDDRPDLFDLYSDDQYHGPSHYSDKFEQCALKTPCFLLPPSDKNHIPPHIVAMALLKQAVLTLQNPITNSN
eukprot:60490_1